MTLNLQLITTLITFNNYFEETVIELGIKEYENFDKNPGSRSLDNVDIAINKCKNHPSIKLINENVSFESRFNFKAQRRWESSVL